jgi:hypothetical protein
VTSLKRGYSHEQQIQPPFRHDWHSCGPWPLSPPWVLANDAKVETGDDKFLDVIRRYESEIDAINASRGWSDDEIADRTDRAYAILEEMEGLPVLTAAGALAALDLVVKESSHSVLEDQFLAFILAVRDYIASTNPTHA